MIYFDYCATTPVDDRVAAFMADLNRRVFGNPSSVHRYGQEARGYVEGARRQLAEALHCEPSEVIFTASGSEANNLVLWNVIYGHRKHVVLSAIEHPSVAQTVKQIEPFGVTSTIVEVDSTGLVDPDSVARAIQENTGLVAIMMANNETGTIEPVRDIARICAEAGVPLHTDAVQALGKLPIDVKSLQEGPGGNVNTMSFSAHKLYGPKGVGALYVRNGTGLRPLIAGGGQEQRRRAGTENVAGIAGFGLAVELAVDQLEAEADRLESLRERFLGKVAPGIPEATVNGHPELHLPGVINMTIPGVASSALLMNLDLDGMAVSNGSACSSGTTKPSRVLKAMGIPDDWNLQTLRISFGRFTQDGDVDRLVETIVKHARHLSEAAGMTVEAAA